MTVFLFSLLNIVMAFADDRICTLNEAILNSPKVECSDGKSYYFEEPVQIVNPETKNFNVECSYASQDEFKDKNLKKLRLIKEDLVRIANGNSPLCYNESEEGEKRKLAKTIKLIVEPLTPVICEPPQPPVVIKVDPKLDPKKYEQKTKINPKKKERTPEEKRAAKLIEKKRYGIKPPTDQTPNRPTTVPEAIILATKSEKQKSKLEICFAVDSSGSMSDDVEIVKKKFEEISQSWGKNYSGRVSLSIVEFAQDSTEKLDLRIKAKNGKAENLKKYTEEFKVQGVIEPKAAAVYECAKKLSQPEPNDLTERHVVVISDEEGDVIKGSPTPEMAAAAVKDKKATLTLIDPDNLPVDPFQFEAPLGTKFTTSKGVVFERVKNAKGEFGWKDQKTGLTWFDEVKKKINFDDAQKFCTNGKTPPSTDDFRMAVGNGIIELLQDMMKKSWWSSSVQAYSPDNAWLFNGDGGYVVNYSRNVNYFSVRCVAR